MAASWSDVRFFIRCEAFIFVVYQSYPMEYETPLLNTEDLYSSNPFELIIDLLSFPQAL